MLKYLTLACKSQMLGPWNEIGHDHRRITPVLAPAPRPRTALSGEDGAWSAHDYCITQCHPIMTIVSTVTTPVMTDTLLIDEYPKTMVPDLYPTF